MMKTCATVNDRYKYVYFEVLKNASRSLHKLFGLKSKTLPGARVIEGHEGSTNDSHYQFKNCQLPEDTKQYYKFGFCRNPWSRAYSCWKNGKGPKALSGDRFQEFQKFLHALKDKNVLTCGDKHILAQNEQLPQDVNYIGRIENIGNDLKKIYSALKCDYTQLEHINKTQTEKSDINTYYRKYYGKEEQMLISEIYHVDIERFKYNF